jgi:hypothetical protein
MGTNGHKKQNNMFKSMVVIQLLCGLQQACGLIAHTPTSLHVRLFACDGAARQRRTVLRLCTATLLPQLLWRECFLFGT